jgi:hypothetical protein
VRALRERAFLKMILIESLEEEPCNVDCFTALFMTQKIKYFNLILSSFPPEKSLFKQKRL